MKKQSYDSYDYNLPSPVEPVGDLEIPKRDQSKSHFVHTNRATHHINGKEPNMDQEIVQQQQAEDDHRPVLVLLDWPFLVRHDTFHRRRCQIMFANVEDTFVEVIHGIRAEVRSLAAATSRTNSINCKEHNTRVELCFEFDYSSEATVARRYKSDATDPHCNDDDIDIAALGSNDTSEWPMLAALAEANIQGHLDRLCSLTRVIRRGVSLVARLSAEQPTTEIQFVDLGSSLYIFPPGADDIEENCCNIWGLWSNLKNPTSDDHGYTALHKMIMTI